MKTNSFKNLILTLVCLVGITGSVFAQVGQNPKQVEKAYVKYVCDNDANTAIDLALDVIGNGFSAEAGKWELVKNEVNSTSNYDANKVIADAKNVFVLSGKRPGVYTFVFTATGVSACIPVGQKRLVKVVILETPKGLSTGLSLCPDASGKIDLKTIVSPSLKNVVFTTSAPANVGTLDANGVFTTTTSFKGFATVMYEVTYEDVLKKSLIANGATAASAACSSMGLISINVTRDGKAPAVKDTNAKKFCIKEVPAAVNLNELLTSVAAGTTANWTVAKTTGNGDSAVTIAKSIATFDKTKLEAGQEYKFTYSFEKTNCYKAGSVSVDFVFTDDLSSAFTDKTKTLCKNNKPNEVINMLRDGLEVDIPLSSGTWKMLKQVTPIVVSDGLFEVDEARAGLYKYEFKVSTASEICGLAGKKANLTIKVVDPNATQDGRMQYCIADLANRKGNFMLADLVPYLPSTGVEWTKIGDDFNSFQGTEGLISYEELKDAGVGTYKFTYSYNAGDCGTATGNVYLTVDDELEVPNEVVLRYCRPDMPKLVNLTQAIGLDVEGTWTKQGAGVLDANAQTFKEADGTQGDQTYTLVFTKSAAKSCGPDKITVTIKVAGNKFE